MSEKLTYLQFPIYLLQEIHSDQHKAFDKMFDCGIYRRAAHLPKEPKDVARQLIYDYYMDKLPYSLVQTIEHYAETGNIDLDPDYKGFTGINGTFDPDYEIQQLVDIFATDPALYSEAFEHFQLHTIELAANSKGISNIRPEAVLSNGLKIDNRGTGKPYSMVTTSVIFDYYKNYKSEFDLMQFAAHAALVSIIGEKPYCKTNKEMILARMFGYASPNTVPDPIPYYIAPLYKKYQTRYHMDKLLNKLKSDWYWLFYAYHTRGIHIAKYQSDYDYETSLKRLILIVESNKEKRRLKELKLKTNEIRKQVIKELQSKAGQ
jgi:hypothetical protein